MKRQKPVTRATSLWLAMGLLTSVGCGGAASPSAQDSKPRTQSGAVEAYGPDLVVTELVAPPSVRQGQQFPATVTVCNQGTDPSSSYISSWVSLYLSLDESLTPQPSGSPPASDQQLIGYAEVPSLSPGQCVSRTVQATAYLPMGAQGDGAYFLGAIADGTQVIYEADETNNAFVAGRMGVGNRPDLVVTAVKGPASVRMGDPLTAAVTVCNQGTEPTNGYYSQAQVELYLSMDTTLTFPSSSGPGAPQATDQRMLASFNVPSLSAGQCVTRTMNAAASLPPDAQGSEGAYYLGAIVDSLQVESELNEGNNTFAGSRMGVGSRADLVVTEVKGPASVRMGDPLTATVKVCNQGTTATGSYSQPQVELYLSMDTTLTPHGQSGPGTQQPSDQRMIGSVSVPSLGAGQCVTRTVNATAYTPPAAMGSEGAYYLGAIVDPSQAEQELREDNNTFVGGLVGVGERADLVVAEVKGPASVRGGDAFTATVTVCNQGTTATDTYSQPQVQLYLSMDTALTLPDPSSPGTPQPVDQRMIGSVNLSTLDAGACVTRSVDVTAFVPQAAMGDGALYLAAIVDPHQGTPELREDNNVLVGGLVGVGHRADLVVTDIRAPASVGNGDLFAASVTVCNQGTESTSGYSGQTSVELYLSMDTTLTPPPTSGPGPQQQPTDQRMVGNFQLPSLAAGQCVTRTVSATAFTPPDALGSEGAYHLGAIVDPYRSEPELREDNNSFIAGLMGVGFRPDLVVTEMSAPASVRHGDAFMASVKVCNQGTTPSSHSNGARVELYLSMDTALTPQGSSSPGMQQPTDQRMIGSVDVPSLDAGQCVTRTVNATGSTPPDALGSEGPYHLGAIVDPSQAEPELREDNNSFIHGLMGVGSRADLVVTEVKGPASVLPGTSFMATVKVCNQGTESTSSWYSQAQLQLYLSTDTTLTAPDPSNPGAPQPMDQRMIGSVNLTALSAGECVSRDVNVYAQTPHGGPIDGAYYLGAIVDTSQAVTELREDNNSLVGGLMGVGHRPDLVVTQISTPASVTPGNNFIARVRVCNQGTEGFGGHGGSRGVELYFSTDTTLTPPSPYGSGTSPTDQRMIGFAELPSLAAGACVVRDVNAQASLPQDALMDGALYVGAIVDPERDEYELREDNNTFIGGLMGVGHRPDLVVTQLSGPASVRDGDAFTATVKVCNQGTGSSYSNSHLELYLSMDTTLTSSYSQGPGPAPQQPTDQRMVASVQVPSLQPGQCATRQLSGHAHRPPAAPYDTALYLGAIVDPTHGIPELREDNNTFIGGLMGVGDRPDLVVTEVKGPPSVGDSDDFTATVTVCNQGTAPVGSYNAPHLQLYMSTDDTLTPPSSGGPGPQLPDDQRMIASVNLPSLQPGECRTLSVPADADLPPAAGGEGAVYLGAIVDVLGTVYELREDNNHFVGGLMGVGHGPDLVVAEVLAPASVQPGSAFTAAVKVCNQGTSGSGLYNPSPARLALYQSVTPSLALPAPGTPPAPDAPQLIASTDLSPLGEGQCVTLSLPASVSTPPGPSQGTVLYLGAIVDADRVEQELREDNNVFIGGPMGVGHRADLVVTEVSGPASAERHASFTASVRVCNQGTEPSHSSSGSTRVQLFLSATDALVAPTPGMPQQPGDPVMVGSVDVPALTPGQCQTLQVQASANPPQLNPGDNLVYLGAIVDTDDSVDELREDNNTLVGGLLGVGTLADVVVAAVSAPASVRHGDAFTAQVQVCNQGTAPSTSLAVNLYISMDTTLSPESQHSTPMDQQQVGNVPVPSLSPGQCVSLTVQGWADLPPAAQGPGSYYLGAYVDPLELEPEFRKDNNARADFAFEVTY
jgi:subtilase family serine protease